MDRNGTKIRYLLVLYIALAVYTVVLSLLFFGRIRANAREANLSQHVAMWLGKDNIFSSSDVDCYLYSARGPVKVTRRIQTTRDELHYSLETLLMPLSTKELQDGLVTYIPKGTKLEGVSCSNGYAFVVLSETFADAEDVDKAMDQIKKTLGLVLDTESLYVYSGEKTFTL